MSRIAIITNFGRSLRQMRGHLLRDLIAAGHQVTVCAPLEDQTQIDALTELGVQFARADVDRTGTNPLRDLGYLWRLIRLIRAARPDVVLAIASKPVIYGGIAARLSGVACYSMIAGLGYVFSGDTLHQRLLALPTRLLYRLGLRRNRRVFFQNPDDLALFHERGMLGSREQGLVVNGDGVDLERFAPVPRPDGAVFLLIGRLLIDKGVREYAAAARLVRKQRPDARFVLVGWFDSNPAAISKDEVDEWVREGLIEFAGFAHDVREFIGACDVYVLPSYREGLPRTTVEAMAMGRPIITTDVPGCRATVEEGVNGVLVPAKDSHALARAMLGLLEDPARLHRMGEESRRMAVEKFGVERINRILLAEMTGADAPSETAPPVAPSASFVIRTAREADCERLAALHLRAFPGFFISQLGARFAARLYRAFVKDELAACFVAESTDDRRLLGFVAGTFDPDTFFARLRRRQAIGFACDALPALLRRPWSIAHRLARGLIYRGERPQSVEGAALLSSIAVAPEHRGGGASRALVEAFCERAREAGARAVYLTTDRDDNARANAFYNRLSFTLHDEIDRSEGRGMNRYIRAL